MLNLKKKKSFSLLSKQLGYLATLPKLSVLLVCFISCRGVETRPFPEVNRCTFLPDYLLCEKPINESCTLSDELYQCSSELGFGYGLLSPLDQLAIERHINELNQDVIDLTIRCGSRCR